MAHRRRSLTWSCALVLAVLTTSCASGAPAGPPVTPTETAEKPVPAPDADATADAFVRALQTRDFDAAAARFDPQMAAALPTSTLRETWDAQVTELGPLVSWEIVERAVQEGLDVRVLLLTHE